LIIIQWLEFYIISKPIYRREILVEKVNIILVVIVNLFLVANSKPNSKKEKITK